MNKKIDYLDFVDFDNNRNNSNSNLLLDLFAIVMRNRWWFVLSVALSLCISVMWVWRTPKIYSRTATILIKSEGSESSSIVETVGLQTGMYLKSDYINDEIGLLKSTRLMSEVVHRLDLDVDYSTKRGFKVVSLYTATPFVLNQSHMTVLSYSFAATMLNRNEVEISDIRSGDVKFDEEYITTIGSEIHTVIGDISLASTLFLDDSYIGKPVYISVYIPEEIAKMYKNKLDVNLLVDQSNLIAISTTDENIKRAEDVINTLIAVYQDDIIDDKNKVLDNTTEFIDERLAIIKQELHDIDAEIENYKKTNRLTDISSESNLYLQSSSRLDNEGLSVENQLNMAEYMRSYLVNNNNISELIPVNVGVSDAGLTKLIGEYNVLLTERNNLLVNSSVNNPLVIDLQNTITPMRASILKSVDNLIAGLKIQAENFRKKEIETSIKIIDVPTQQKYIISVQREQKIKEELYLFLLNKREGSELRRTITESNSQIVDKAQGPSSPIAPNKKKIALLAIVIGLMIPSAWLYLVSLFDVNVKSINDLKGVITIPLLGEVPAAKEIESNGVAVLDGSRNVISERLKIVRDNINFMSKGDGDKSKGKVIQLTSFNPGSGKTFLAINLAKSISFADSKVVVVDLDLRRASLSKRSGFGVKTTGISQYLSGNVDNFSDIIRPFDSGIDAWVNFMQRDRKDVDIITSGAIPPNPAELLEGERLPKLIDYLRENYDFVIIDNPPFAIVVDAAICARLCDQTIYVIRSNKFDKRQLPELQALYESGKVNNMSVLVNSVDFNNIGYGYGYGYGSSYGYGYSYNYEYGAEEEKPFYKRLFRL
ncbi:MAG: polysaccharide biosynthesis tyrosine autokinase [Rikenellaceae bacterium]